MLTATQQNDEIGGFTHQPEAMEVGACPATALHEYLADALQRSAIFLDVLRQRGNAQEAISGRPMAALLLKREPRARMAAISPEMSLTIDQLAAGDAVSLKRAFESVDLKAWASATGEGVSSGDGHRLMDVCLTKHPTHDEHRDESEPDDS